MTQQIPGRVQAATAPENYERYFVPAIGAPLAEELVEKAKLHSGEKILDVACGTGVVTRLAAKEVGPSGKVDGLDFNQEMLDVARTVTPGASFIEWHHATATAMPLPSNKYDVVVCQLGLQFVQDKEAALKEMHRVMAPGGRLVINVPGPESPLFKSMDKALGKHVGPQAAAFVDNVFSLYEPSQIKNMLTKAGFKNVTVEREDKSMSLPAGKDFLWQYIYSTPMANAMKKVSDEQLKALEEDVLKDWRPFEKNGSLQYEQGITFAMAEK